MDTERKIAKFTKHVRGATAALKSRETLLRNVEANDETIKNHLARANEIIRDAEYEDDKAFWTWAECKGRSTFDRLYAAERAYYCA